MKRFTTLLLLLTLLLSVLASCQGTVPTGSLPQTQPKAPLTEETKTSEHKETASSPKESFDVFDFDSSKALDDFFEVSLEKAQRLLEADVIGGRKFGTEEATLEIAPNVTLSLLLLEKERITLPLSKFFARLEQVAQEEGIPPERILFLGDDAQKIRLPSPGEYVVNNTLCYFHDRGTVTEYTMNGPRIVGSRAFQGNQALKSITLDSGVFEIHSGAFEGIPSLEKVLLSPYYYRVIDYTFPQKWVSSLDTFKEINEVPRNGVFAATTENGYLEWIQELAKHHREINPFTLEGRKALLEQAQLSAPLDDDPRHFLISDGVLLAYFGIGGHVVIPEGVTEIRGGVFENVKDNLLSVKLPSSLKKICTGAFANHSLLAEIEIPENVEVIESYAIVSPFDELVADEDLLCTYVTGIPQGCQVAENAIVSRTSPSYRD